MIVSLERKVDEKKSAMLQTSIQDVINNIVVMIDCQLVYFTTPIWFPHHQTLFNWLYERVEQHGKKVLELTRKNPGPCNGEAVGIHSNINQ